ncbi:MAG: hypothetical protein IT220_02710 [Flavobacteriaceae bacterium]|nr:hypothetical protein [Flavobacteriaceae bacterium]
MKNLLIKILVLFFLSIHLSAQDSIQKTTNMNIQVLDKGNLMEQKQFIIENSFVKGSFISTKTDWLNKFHTHILDSVNKLKTELTVAKQQATTILNENNALKSEVSQNEEMLLKKDTISFLGIPMSKIAYKSIMWILVILLAAGLGYYVYKFKNSHVLTKAAIQRYEELEEEYKESRSRSLEREQLLNRKLFDEQKKNNK